MTTELITSPEGTIEFMALRFKVAKKPTDEEKTVYAVKLSFEDNAANQSFKNQIQAINPKLVGTNPDAPGRFTVRASSKYEVRVLDTSGNKITQSEIPVMTKGSTGTAVVMLKPYMGNKLGGSLNLVGVAITSLDLAEGGDLASTDTIESRLRAAQEAAGD